jgi:hypothetical protein
MSYTKYLGTLNVVHKVPRTLNVVHEITETTTHPTRGLACAPRTPGGVSDWYPPDGFDSVRARAFRYCTRGAGPYGRHG